MKLAAGSPFAPISVFDDEGREVTIEPKSSGSKWKLLIIYRGRHCPLCTRFLNEFEAYLERLNAINIESVAMSGDSLEQYNSHKENLNCSFPYFKISLPRILEFTPVVYPYSMDSR